MVSHGRGGFEFLHELDKDNWRELFIRQPSWTDGDRGTVQDKKPHRLDFLVSPCKWIPEYEMHLTLPFRLTWILCSQ